MTNDTENDSISSDRIRAILREADRPLTRRHLSSVFEIDKETSDRVLSPLLKQMVASGEVVRNRRAAYGLADDLDLVRGRVSAHPDGFGFVIPEEDGEDLYLSPKQMKLVFNGDQVLAAVTGIDRRGRKQGGIVEIVERAHTQVVGRFLLESGLATVVPDDPRLTQDVRIPLEAVGNAKPGQIVVARITHSPTAERGPVGEISAVLGQADEPGIATDVAIFSHDLPHEFPAEVSESADAFGASIDPDLAANRLDLRDLPLLTIDGADARDFDDAVYAERNGSGFLLLVAIADVAEYVEPGSALDVEAHKRGTSVYFPDRVIPMLPEALSNGLCSLRPDEDRLCLVCQMRLDENGKVIASSFDEAVMRSHARLTYEQVDRMIDRGDAELRERFAPVMGNLETLFEVYRTLFRRRQRRGALDFNSQDVYFQFDAEGRVADIRPRTRLNVHRLIEECMVSANVQAAKFVSKNKLPMLFRVHEPPPAEKLEGLETFIRAQGLKVAWSESPEPAQFAALQSQVADGPREQLVNAVLLRSLSLAVYQPENKGHFGLALEHYAHFTSPIRRYPDLLLHRAIKHLCRERPREQFGYSGQQMTELGRRCSWTERRAEDAARSVDERLKCQFMQRHIGDHFQGVVTGVTSFGLFVELDRLGVSGLVHVTAMPEDFYNFDPVSHSLTGKRGGRQFALADAVEVEVLAVNLEERKIDLQLVESSR